MRGGLNFATLCSGAGDAEPGGDRVAERGAGKWQGRQHALHPGEQGPLQIRHHVRIRVSDHIPSQGI